MITRDIVTGYSGKMIEPCKGDTMGDSEPVPPFLTTGSSLPPSPRPRIPSPKRANPEILTRNEGQCSLE